MATANRPQTTSPPHHRPFLMGRTLCRGSDNAGRGEPYQPPVRRGSARQAPPQRRKPRHHARRPTERSELGCWPVGDGQHLLFIVGHTGPRGALAPPMHQVAWHNAPAPITRPARRDHDAVSPTSRAKHPATDTSTPGSGARFPPARQPRRGHKHPGPVSYTHLTLPTICSV